MSPSILPQSFLLASCVTFLALSGCLATRHPTQAASSDALPGVQSAHVVTSTGTPGALAPASLEASLDPAVGGGLNGPLQIETVRAADWEVPLSGVLNLDHPKAEAAGLEDRSEPIGVYFHAIRHPQHGLFIIDTGLERDLIEAPKRAAIRGVVASVMKLEKMTIHHTTADWLEAQPDSLRGVLLTHLHLDHISGMRDIPSGTPIYAGPGETGGRKFENLFVRSVFDRALDGQAPLSEWQFVPDLDGNFEGVFDVFGDGSLWAISVPGHTTGSTAFLARGVDGPVLFTGDASHTAWGWNNGVEPGTYTHDHEANRRSLEALKSFSQAHPEVEVRLGHQEL